MLEGTTEGGSVGIGVVVGGVVVVVGGTVVVVFSADALLLAVVPVTFTVVAAGTSVDVWETTVDEFINNTNKTLHAKARNNFVFMFTAMLYTKLNHG